MTQTPTLSKARTAYHSLPSQSLSRDRVQEIYDHALSKPIVFLAAPSGYGKTVNTQLCLHKAGFTQWWFELDQFSNRTVAFLRRLYLVLQPLFHADPLPQGLSKDEIVEILWQLLGLMPVDTEKHALVFDNFQYLSDPELVNFLPALLKRLSLHMQVVLLSRLPMPPQLADLYTKGYIQLIDKEVLLFSDKDVTALFLLRNRILSNIELDSIMKSSWGWPIGVSTAFNLYCSNNSLIASAQEQIAIESVAITLLENYIRVQIWENYPQDIRDSLLPTACVDSFNVSLWSALMRHDDSEKLLGELLVQNSFLREITPQVYAWNPLIRSFMRREWERCTPAQEKRETYAFLKDYFLEAKQPWEANKFILRAGTTQALEEVFSSLMDLANGSASEYIRQFQPLLQHSEAVSQLRPRYRLLFIRYYYLCGDFSSLYSQFDLFYAACEADPSVVAELNRGTLALCLLDHRRSLTELLERYSTPVADGNVSGASISVTQSFLYVHRGFCDFSAYATANENSFASLWHLYVPLLGANYDIVEDCLRAGLYWEQGFTLQAREYALSASTRINEQTSSELRFAAQALLERINLDLNRVVKSDNALFTLSAEGEAAFMLPNYRAQAMCYELSSGSSSRIAEWLSEHNSDLSGSLLFYRLYEHFATLRALIASGDGDKALHFGDRLLKLVTEYRRPLDIIETKTLLSIARWRSGDKETACSLLKEALQAAQVYGFIRVFAAEGAAVLPIVSRLSRGLNASGDEEVLQPAFVKKVLSACSTQARRGKGLAGDKPEKPLRLSKQQKIILQLMTEGMKMSDIATRIGLKVTTVRTHVSQVYRKLEVNNAGEAISKARKLKLIE